MTETRAFTLATKLEAALEYMVCAKCKKGPLSEIGVEWDHVSPWAISKDRSAKNCQPLCPECHAFKTNGAKHFNSGDKSLIPKIRRLANPEKKMNRKRRRIRGRTTIPPSTPLKGQSFQKRRKEPDARPA